ncbi:MAG: twin-arginine translocase subunit TatC [Thermomicrobiales bacterium]
MASITDRLPLPWKSSGDGPPPDQDLPPGEDGNEDPEFFLEMTLAEHLEELRIRIIYSTLTILAALVAAFFIVDWVFKEVAIQANISNEEIPTLSPTEGFVTWFKVLLYIAIALSMPMLVFQILRYIAPGLTKREKRAVYLSLPVVSLLFISGMAFAFFVAIPRALEFLSNFKSDLFLWSPRASELVTFYLRLMLGIGIAFELPALMFVLGKLGIVNHQQLGRARKFAFILVLVAAAIITPTPDPVNMMIIAVPIYILYELGIIFVRFT